MNRFVEQLSERVGRLDAAGVADLLRLDADALAGGWATVREAVKAMGKERGPQELYDSVAAKGAAIGLSASFCGLCAAHMTVVALLGKAQLGEVGEQARVEALRQAFKFQLEAFDKFLEIYKADGSWMLPTMRVLIRDTRILAVKTDRDVGNRNNENLRETKQLLENCFRYSTMGRATTEDAHRKRAGALYIVNDQFKVYFGLKSLQLCRNLIRQVEMPTFPDMETFPLAQRVTYHFYLGRLLVFENRLPEAREAFEFALRNCPASRPANVRRIFEFLVPINLFIGRRPAPGVLAKNGIEYLQELVDAVRQGNVRALAKTIERHRDKYISRGLYLSLDSLKTVAYRNLFRNVVHVYKASAAERKDRVPLDVFVTPFDIFGEEDPLAFLEDSKEAGERPSSREDVLEQIKCILANLIHHRYIKAYISHEKEMLVLSPKDPFPPLSSATE